MKKSKRFCFSPIVMGVVFSLAIMIAGTCASAAGIVVVANKNAPQSALSKDHLKAIFLGQMTAWGNGAKIEFVTLKDSSEIHEEFLKKYVDKSTAQFSNFWKQQVFTGKGRFPKQFDSESKLIEYVSATDGAIGYVSGSAAKGSAKVIAISE